MDLKKKIENFGADFSKYFSEGSYTKSRKILINAIEYIKHKLCDNEIGESLKNEIYYWAVLFRALIDYTQLHEIIVQDSWARDNKKIEQAWDLVWNCKDRLDFCDSRIMGASMDKVQGLIEYVLCFFKRNFGEGYYNSAEILVRSVKCNICGNNIKHCYHIPNRIYSGRRCFGIPIDFELKSVSIVKVPLDPRCRIWPWNIKENRIVETPIFCFFAIDDFLENDNWK
jgi:hypothetical protein